MFLMTLLYLLLQYLHQVEECEERLQWRQKWMGYPDVEALSDVCVEERESDPGGAQVKYLRVGEIQYVEAVVEQLYKEGKFDEPSCARLLALVAGTCGNLKVPRAPGGAGMMLVPTCMQAPSASPAMVVIFPGWLATSMLTC